LKVNLAAISIPATVDIEDKPIFEYWREVYRY